ncbi:hypothetical protein [Photobacterium damselae]
MRLKHPTIAFILSLQIIPCYAGFSPEQVAAWQQEIAQLNYSQNAQQQQENSSIDPRQQQALNQLNRLKSNSPLTPENLKFSEERIAKIKAKAQHKINNPDYYDRIQLFEHCSTDIRLYCAHHNQSLDTVRNCLTAKQSRVSIGCNQALAHRHSGKKTIGTLLYRNIAIPEGSVFYSIAKDQKVGVSLSRPTTMQGISIKRDLIFWPSGQIAQFTPTDNIRYNGLIFPSNLPVKLFENGDLEFFYLAAPTQIGNVLFEPGKPIYRNSPTTTWMQ